MIFSFTARVTKTKITATALCVAAVATFVLAAAFYAPETQAALGDSSALREQFLRSFGYECDISSETEKQTVIPSEFDEVYSKYNDLQKSQGYDLSAYRGKTVKLYSVRITNYDNEQNVYASLLVLDGKIIGGDVHSTELDGFMHGFKKVS